MRRSIRRGVVPAALAGTALVAAAPAAFAQTTSPEAFGIEATGALRVAPTPDATLANPNPAPVPSFLAPTVLNATAPSASVTTNSATATVGGLNTTGVTAPLLGIVTGSTITSSCLANADGTIVRTASITGLSLLGQPVTIPDPLPVNDNISASIPGLGVIATVTLNYQATGPITGSVTEDAIHIALPGSTEVVNIADSTCGPFSADTPVASGKGLVLGLGLLGSVGVGYGAVYTRRRRSSAI